LISSTYPNTTQKAHPAVCCIQKLHQLATFFSLFYKNSSEGRHDKKNETPKIFSFLMMTVRKFKKKKEQMKCEATPHLSMRCAQFTSSEYLITTS